MRASDLQRIIRGCGLITQAVLAKKGPEAQKTVTRMQNAIVDLAQAMAEARHFANNNTSNSSEQDRQQYQHYQHDEQNHNSVQNNSSEPMFYYGPKAAAAAAAASQRQSSQSVSEAVNKTENFAQASPIQSHGEHHAHTHSHRDGHRRKVADVINFPDLEQFGEDVLSELQNSSKKANMKAKKIPATPISRMWGFGSLAVRMAMGAAKDSATRVISGDSEETKARISAENADRLADALCRMRGAALKLGQMLSLQDEGVVPSTLTRALERVRQSADYMPEKQLTTQLVSQLGSDWRSKFSEFDEVPIAAASIGQVHKAKLLDGSPVAIKIQYPGVAESIDSDLLNLKRLVQMTNLLPPGLYVDEIIRVAGSELKAECDYETEADSQIRYRGLIESSPLLSKYLYVPKVYKDVCTKRVLVTELIQGIPVDQAANLPQEIRNAIARTMLILTIQELFVWRFMQSDPNFANFLFDAKSKTINLIDFGASREYPKKFVDGYVQLVWAAANKDSDTVLRVSKELGFLTGDEAQEMITAHIESGMVVGEPFLDMKPYDFGSSRLTARIGQHGDTFMKYRLTPPPSEAYSLHRKLAGAFLLCIRLKAVIPCRDILEDVYKSYKFD